MLSKILFTIIVICLFFVACKDSSKNNSSNTFYVDYSCKNDTLAEYLQKITSGKISYYDHEKKLQIVPVTYVTEDHPQTHYFKVKEELPSKPDLNTIKYEIIFNNSMNNDSIAYSLKKYIYTESGWNKKSDMGVLKVFGYLSDFDKKLRIIKKNVAVSVFQVVVTDSYDN